MLKIQCCICSRFGVFLNSGGRAPAPHAGNTNLLCRALMTHSNPVLPWSTQKQNPCGPQALLLEEAHARADKNTARITRVSQSQWLFLPSTRTECQRRATEAGQPGVLCPCHGQMLSMEDHQGHSVWMGMAGDARTTPAASRLLSPVLLWASTEVMLAGWAVCKLLHSCRDVTDRRSDRPTFFQVCVLCQQTRFLSTVSLFPPASCDFGHANKNVDKVSYGGLNLSAIQYTVVLA